MDSQSKEEGGCEYISQIQEQLEAIAQLIYKNPRVKDLNISVGTLMGSSVSYLSSGDCLSPECKVEYRKEIERRQQYAIQKYKRPTSSYSKVARGGSKNIQDGLQQWV